MGGVSLKSKNYHKYKTALSFPPPRLSFRLKSEKTSKMFTYHCYKPYLVILCKIEISPRIWHSVLRKIIFYPIFLDSAKFNIDPRIIQFAVLNNIHILFTFCKNINLHLTRNVAFGVRNNLHFTSNPSLPVKPVKNHSNIMSFIFRYFKTFSPHCYPNIFEETF